MQELKPQPGLPDAEIKTCEISWRLSVSSYSWLDLRMRRVLYESSLLVRSIVSLSFWLDPKGHKRSRLVKRLFLLRKKIFRPAYAGKPGDLLVPLRSFQACDPSFATAGKPPFHEAIHSKHSSILHFLTAL
jgi:hypothetical protein